MGCGAGVGPCRWAGWAAAGEWNAAIGGSAGKSGRPGSLLSCSGLKCIEARCELATAKRTGKLRSEPKHRKQGANARRARQF